MTMAGASVHVLLLIFLFSSLLILPPPCSASEARKSYIVYLGGSSSGETYEVAEAAHMELLSSIFTSGEEEKKQSIVMDRVYHHSFRGFSAMLTEKEASLLSDDGDVVSMFPDPQLQLHTTRSWDFLDEDFSHAGHNNNNSQLPSSKYDVIIGMIDTGIWPESPSFSDKGIGEIPARWKGVCMEGFDFKKSNCNRKLIGARYYNTQFSFFKQNTTAADSPRDHVGHGTHTASIAAGSHVFNASYYGLAQGTARGGSPSSRIAVYKACSLDNCSGSAILKAIDDAVKDGVDIISVSIGMDLLLQPDFLGDPIAIGAFHATQKGVLVVGSAGNYGPDPYSVVNTAPWILTVAASTIDREFESSVVLADNTTRFTGSAINFSKLKEYRLAFAGDVAADFTPKSEASNCHPGSLNEKKVSGKIIVCVDSDPSISRKIKKLVAEDAGAVGVVYISNSQKGTPLDTGAFPFVQLTEDVGSDILNYINRTKNPTATILPTTIAAKPKPAPAIADFSSRGPGEITENILKPDIVAPGVAILAAVAPDTEESGYDPVSKQSPKFAIKSGTSMACPHVTGAAAFIKSVHPQWTPSMIRSALITTATTSNNAGESLSNSTVGSIANPHETGAGEVSPVKALDPGLVFPTTTEDYLRFLCYCGYSEKNIRSMTNTKFNCPKLSRDTFVSDINYPTISIGKLRTNHTRRITRHVMNVGTTTTTYTLTSIKAPRDFTVSVHPRKLVFSGKEASSFHVVFSIGEGLKKQEEGYKYGSLTWSDGKHHVRVVFAVNVLV